MKFGIKELCEKLLSQCNYVGSDSFNSYFIWISTCVFVKISIHIHVVYLHICFYVALFIGYKDTTNYLVHQIC